MVPIKCEVLRKLSFYLNYDKNSEIGHLQIKDFFHHKIREIFERELEIPLSFDALLDNNLTKIDKLMLNFWLVLQNQMDSKLPELAEISGDVP